MGPMSTTTFRQWVVIDGIFAAAIYSPKGVPIEFKIVLNTLRGQRLENTILFRKVDGEYPLESDPIRHVRL